MGRGIVITRLPTTSTTTDVDGAAAAAHLGNAGPLVGAMLDSGTASLVRRASVGVTLCLAFICPAPSVRGLPRRGGG